MKHFMRYVPHLCLAVVAALALPGCATQPAPTAAMPDLAPFTEMAESAACADRVNRLYVIDNQMVFWTTSGNCADASYAHTLFGETPDQQLCITHDSIAGPQTNCQPEYEALFQTILAHLGEPDLGLGGEHTVESVEVTQP